MLINFIFPLLEKINTKVQNQDWEFSPAKVHEALGSTLNTEKKKKKSNQIKHMNFKSNEYANVYGNTKQQENNFICQC